MAATRPDIDVSRVAALARLELTPEETALFTRQLSEILAYAEAVQQIDTTGVLKEAPEASLSAGLFKVPKVL
jgi:aspartyl/glutamyl-tRNA(Asn/Gln) amidotransferase C subunit